ncbi:Intraflagellar transport complex B protein 46 like protein [Aduncisulcus paluster]|uniref:Intraflagellar transport complex B protein 46 like protein n=1 Tax=Aduncisulcus paluster TaxID=2918883 RepID=A0ABQ5JZM5_9EUKA|nr:Intraflagellar transport complex B protein 46 like protein [Aduncisulcus paluster]
MPIDESYENNDFEENDSDEVEMEEEEVEGRFDGTDGLEEFDPIEDDTFGATSPTHTIDNDNDSMFSGGDDSALFDFIDAFQPHEIQLDTKLQPFVFEYMPAIGDIDPFVKVERPDGKKDLLGVAIPDEAANIQSDPSVLEVKLQSISKQYGIMHSQSGGVWTAETDEDIDKWIDEIEKIHAEQPPSEFVYSDTMPDVESLMDTLPREVEMTLRKTGIPPPDIDLSLEEYARVVCSLCDIPVHSTRSGLVEALHLFFTLFSDIQQNQHFDHNFE